MFYFNTYLKKYTNNDSFILTTKECICNSRYNQNTTHCNTYYKTNICTPICWLHGYCCVWIHDVCSCV